MPRDLDLPALRADTPGCDHHIHLNNAGSSLMSTPVTGAIQDHLALEALLGGYEAAAVREDAIAAAYQSVASLLGARADQIAFTDNATTAYAQALSSIAFAPGDVVLTTRNDYVSNQIQLFSLRDRLGIRIIRAPDLPEGGVDPQAMADLIREHRPRLVCVTHVPTNSGLVQDIAAIGRACREHDVWYLVDACQSAGQMTVSPVHIGCDFLSGTFRKFLRGPRGVGFLWLSDRVLERGLQPLFIDLRGARWTDDDAYRAVKGAARFETWEFAWALVLGAAAAARYAGDIGIDLIEARVRRLAQRLRNQLAALDGVRVLDRGRDLSGIVSVAVHAMESPALATALRLRGVYVSGQTRPFALLDYDDKGVTTSLRLSPHYFNTEAELDRTIDAIADVLGREPKAGYGAGARR